MHKHGSKKVVAVVEDLFFSVKIADTAKRLGLETVFVKTEKDAIEQAHTQPLVIIIDLNIHSVQALKLIEKLKSDPITKGISALAFVSHIQGELKQKAQELGCNMVMAKSAFSQNLPLILKRHAGVVIQNQS